MGGWVEREAGERGGAGERGRLGREGGWGEREPEREDGERGET